jgi:UPF0271 protein
MGEGMGNEELIMPFITSANIACGYHAGDAASIHQTIKLCIKNNVAIGAHPSFYDKENFGRNPINLPLQEVYELIIQQLVILTEIAAPDNTTLHHVKPHGALYNMSAKDVSIAHVIAKAVKDFDSHLILFGLSGSLSIKEADKIGLQTASEVFADRTYQDDSSLTPRTQAGALIEQKDKMILQVLQIVNEGTVTTQSGKKISILAETICIHGDGKHAVEFAEAIYSTFKTA